MKFVFLDIGLYEAPLKEMLTSCLATAMAVPSCITMTEQDLPGALSFSPSEEYCIFYLVSGSFHPRRIKAYTRAHRLKVFLVGLCKDACEGITAMEGGSQYALAVPLQRSRVLGCCQHLFHHTQRNLE